MNKKYVECKNKCEELLRFYANHSEEINELLSRCNNLISEQQAAEAAEQQAQAEAAAIAADLERQYKTEYSELQFLIIDKKWTDGIAKCEAMLDKYPNHKAEIESTYWQCVEAKSYTTPMQAVDLGLSVLWADRNVGAESISGYGNRYSETGAISAADSVGNGWRLPTVYELWELQNYVLTHNYNWGKRGDVNGLYVTGENGGIFLPAAGFKRSTPWQSWISKIGFNTSCRYYSSTKDFGHDGKLYAVSFEANPAKSNIGSVDRNTTDYSSVRLVRDKAKKLIKKPELVDMGLSVLWSSWNLGASSVAEFGNYYAWGETFQRNDLFDWNTYKYFHDKDGNRTPYNDKEKPQNEELTFIGNDIAGTQYDAATIVLGDGWMTPNESHWKELMHNCWWQWDSIDGVRGYVVKSRINGNMIFLPAAGVRDGYKLVAGNECGIYMSSELHNVIQVMDYNLKQHNYVTTNSYFNEMLQFAQQARNAQIVYSYYEAGYPYSSLLKRFHSRCNGQSIRPVKVNNNVYRPTTDTTTYKPHAVDLGLSVLWADCNVGATSPTGTGQVYAWGETAPKILYDWSTYQFFNDKDGNGNPYKKDDYEKLNKSELKNLGKDIAGTRYDVATQLWGNGWSMPSIEQWQELIDKCKWVRTTKNGVGGFAVTGPNGNSIFLPFVVSRTDDEDTYGDRYCSYYWCSDRGSFDNVDATTTCVSLFSDDRFWFADICYGCAVRPIKSK